MESSNRLVSLDNVYLATITETKERNIKEENIVLFEKTDYTLGINNKKTYTQYKDLGTGVYYYVSESGTTLIADKNYNEFKSNVKFTTSNLRTLKETLEEGAKLKVTKKSSTDFESAILFCKTFQKHVYLLEKETSDIEVDEMTMSACYELLMNIYSYVYLGKEPKEKELTELEKYITSLDDQKMKKQKEQKRPKLKLLSGNKLK